MTLNWTNIPSHIFENIFSYCSFNDCKQLSLVCKSWYEEIADTWRSRFAIKCCNIGYEENLEKLYKSKRQYQTISVCHSHVQLANKILTILATRKLLKPSKISHMSFNGVFYTAYTQLDEIVDLLNNHGDNLEILKLSGLTDEKVGGDSDLVLKVLTKVRTLEIKGLLQVSESNLNILYSGFVNLTKLNLNLNRVKCFTKKFHIISNLVLNNKDTLEHLSIELEVDNCPANYYLDTLKYLKNLKSLSLTFSDRSHSNLRVYFLSDLNKLKSLHLIGCYISNEDILKIPKFCNNLEEIKLHLNKEIDEGALRSIGELSTISTVDLLFDSEFPGWLANWFNFCNKNIKTLKLSGCRRFHDYFVSKTLQDRINYAMKNPLCIDNVLKNLVQLENLVVKMSALSLENPSDLSFPKLKTVTLDDCCSATSTHEFFEKFKAPSLISMRTDILGMTDETVHVLLNNFENILDLHLNSEDKLSIKAMKSISAKGLKSVKCQNLSFEMGEELLKNSKSLEFASLKFNIPQMDAEERIKYENEHKDIILTAQSFDHEAAHKYLDILCRLFDPPLVKSTNQGWVVGSQCYRTYTLNGQGIDLDIAMKFNVFLEN